MHISKIENSLSQKLQIQKLGGIAGCLFHHGWKKFSLCASVSGVSFAFYSDVILLTCHTRCCWSLWMAFPPLMSLWDTDSQHQHNTTENCTDVATSSVMYIFLFTQRDKRTSSGGRRIHFTRNNGNCREKRHARHT